MYNRDGSRLAPAPLRVAIVAAMLLALDVPRAQAATPSEPSRDSEVLHELNGAVAHLAAKVSPAVVQIEVTAYAPAGEPGRADAAFLARQHTIGSGVIVDPNGYVLTNAHVVHGAQRVLVVLAAPPGVAPAGANASARRIYAASVVGTDPSVDLAVLKIDAARLSFLPLDGAVKVRQGELVFAVGSPQGLASTVTMGVVGSPGRQVDFAQPMAFIQTDAPINPGNSGGPLVNVDGALAGINTFILSQSGGSQGLGFAIPADVARAIYDGLRKRGRVQRVELGVATQAVTPSLAGGLGLPRDWGVVVADVLPDGAAGKAGVQAGDVIDTFDGRPIDSLAAITTALYLHGIDRPVALSVLRGAKRLTFELDAPESRHPTDQLVDLANPERGLVAKLGMIGLDVTPKLAGLIAPLRIASGVVVAARTLDATSLESGLQSGDVIHAVNRTDVDSLETLRREITGLRPGAPVVLQVERQGKLAYLAFDME
jgi:serine protease Do